MRSYLDNSDSLFFFFFLHRMEISRFSQDLQVENQTLFHIKTSFNILCA